MKVLLLIDLVCAGLFFLGFYYFSFPGEFDGYLMGCYGAVTYLILNYSLGQVLND